MIKMVNKAVIFQFLIPVASLLVYFNTLQNGFVYDDYDYIVKSEFIISWKNLLFFLSPKDWKLLSHVDLNRPLMTVSLMFDYSLWGLNPLGYHLTNIILHTVNVFLFYNLIFAVKKGGGNAVALCSSLIFALHPINTEAVNAISYREDLLVTTFFLLSFVFGIKCNTNGLKNCIPSLIFFFLALLSKEMAVTLPIIIFLYHTIYKHQRNKILYLGYAVLVLLYFIFVFILHQKSGIYEQVLKEGISFQNKLGQQAYIFLSYLQLLFLPISLNADYVIALKSRLDSVIILFVLITTGSLIVAYLRNRFLTFFAAWFFITLLPVSNILPLTTPMAERYLYLPSIGCFAIIGLTIGYLFERFKMHPLLAITLALTYLFFSVNTFNRNPIWRDNFTLWRDTVLKSPSSEHAHYNLANEYSKKGYIDEAISEYQLSIAIKPMVDVYVNIGITYKKKNQYDLAMLQFNKALAINPRHSLARANLGLLYERMGYVDKAIYEYQQILKSDPAFVYAHMRLGIIYRGQGNIEDAIGEFRKILEIDPGDNAAKLWLDEATSSMLRQW